MKRKSKLQHYNYSETEPISIRPFSVENHQKLCALQGSYRGRELSNRASTAQYKPLYTYVAGHNYYGQCGLIGNTIEMEEMNQPHPDRESGIGNTDLIT